MQACSACSGSAPASTTRPSRSSAPPTRIAAPRRAMPETAADPGHARRDSRRRARRPLRGADGRPRRAARSRSSSAAPECGSRFHGDLQGLENWTTSERRPRGAGVHGNRADVRSRRDPRRGLLRSRRPRAAAPVGPPGLLPRPPRRRRRHAGPGLEVPGPDGGREDPLRRGVRHPAGRADPHARPGTLRRPRRRLRLRDRHGRRGLRRALRPARAQGLRVSPGLPRLGHRGVLSLRRLRQRPRVPGDARGTSSRSTRA